MRWQLALYRAMAGKAEDSDSPEKIVRRVQEVSAVLYHLEQVGGGLGGWGGVPEGLLGVLRGSWGSLECCWVPWGALGGWGGVPDVLLGVPEVLLGVPDVLLGGLQMSMGVSGML